MFDKSGYNNVLESAILDYELFVQFIKICDFDIDHKTFKLLYRGSQDGFRGTDFHSKCDNRSNTVTFIETTSGFIFGGCIQAIWTSNGQYAYDSNAFLFSLINPFKKPFLSHVVKPEKAIYNNPNLGPTFGNGYDILICDNFNDKTAKNHVGLGHSYSKPNDINDSNGFYFCENKNFMGKEIEVFQIENN